MSDSVRPHRRQPTRVPHPWDSPGKNTGVGCHFLLQSMKVKSESAVAQSCLTPRKPHGLQHFRLLHPWDFPGKSTGVGCHCLLHSLNRYAKWQIFLVVTLLIICWSYRCQRLQFPLVFLSHPLLFCINFPKNSFLNKDCVLQIFQLCPVETNDGRVCKGKLFYNLLITSVFW